MMAGSVSGAVVSNADSAHDGLSGSAGTPPRADSSEIAALVNAAAAGDPNAWDALVNRFAATVWAVARGHRLSAADAADVSQTTWLRLVENLHRIRQPERVGAWLAVTARRESLRVLRIGARQTATGHDFDVLPDPVPATPPEHVVATREWTTVVSDLVDQLPTRSQLLLRLLSADSPLSYRDISEALDMPIGSIGPTRARALEQFKRLAVKAGIKPEDVFI
jgi:RNA polymerase sigma factor (sigma-70 family)